MTEWKTLKQETLEVGGKNFLEINIKQAPEGENLYVGLSKGWFNDEGQKRYKANILFTKDKLPEIIKVLEEIQKE